MLLWSPVNKPMNSKKSFKNKIVIPLNITITWWCYYHLFFITN